MKEKVITRKTKYEDYRPDIKKNKSKKQSETTNLESKKQLNPLIVEMKKKRFRKRFIYYSSVTIFAFLLMFMILFFGIRYL